MTGSAFLKVKGEGTLKDEKKRLPIAKQPSFAHDGMDPWERMEGDE